MSSFGIQKTVTICLKVIRIHIVAGGFLGYCLGVLLALVMGGKTSYETFFLGYSVVLFGDLATHFSNDYYDVNIDKNAPLKPFGGSNILVKHPEVRSLTIWIALFLSAGSLFFAFMLVYIFGFQSLIMYLVAITNLFGWLYSATPVQLNSRRFGEVTIAIGTGFSIPAVGYVITLGVIDRTFLIFSIPLVLYGFILSLSLELPDLEVDQDNGRNNLVVLLGRRKTAFLIVITSMLAAAFFIVLAWINYSKFWFLPVLSMLPIIAGIKGYAQARLPSLFDQDYAYYLSRMNISSLFIFLVLLDSYFLLSLK